jgi:double-stranded uracil-DNA glycosylase
MLPDVLAPGLNVVFCGTAAGAVSARVGAPYAGPGNKFWPTVHAVGLTPRRLQPLEFRSALEYGIGITDLAKTVSGADSVLRSSHFDAEAFGLKIERFAPAIVAFTGKRSAQEFIRRPVAYGRQDFSIGTSEVWVLPSPSGAASGFWDIRYWRELAEAVRTLKRREPAEAGSRSKD